LRLSNRAREAIPALALIAVGLVALAAGTLAFPHAGDPAYVHTVEPISREEVPAEVNVTNYSDLSPNGKAAFRTAVASSDGSYVVRSEAEKPPEFFYSDYSVPGRGLYVVRYESDYYRLSTSAGGGFGFVAYGVKVALWAIGGLFVLVGGLSVATGRPRPALAVWVGAAGALGAFALGPFVGLGFVPMSPVAALAFVAVALLGYRYVPVD